VTDRLMSHAPPPFANWPSRYLVDLKSVHYFQNADGNWSKQDLSPYASGDIFSYVDTLREAMFTLSPPGDVWEAYRNWEAMEAGSIPVVVDNETYKLEGCERPALHLQETAPFVLSVRSWDELPALLERIASNVSSVVDRQAAMLRWLAKRKADVRDEIIQTSRMMQAQKWQPRTSCHITPLTPRQIAAQHRALAKYWRKPQNQSVGGAWYDGWSKWGNTPLPFHGENGMCEVPPNENADDFTETCKAQGCAPSIIASFECGAAR